MALFPEASMIMMMVACLCFTGVFAVLILPDTLLTVCYLAPKTIAYILNKKLRGQALWALLCRPLTLLATAAFLLVCAFLLDPATARYLIMSPVAFVCWFITIPATLWLLIAKRRDFLSRYYTGIYMEYLTKAEYDNFSKYVEKVDTFSIHDARIELENKSLSFLEKRALAERILLLQGTDIDRR